MVATGTGKTLFLISVKLLVRDSNVIFLCCELNFSLLLGVNNMNGVGGVLAADSSKKKKKKNNTDESPADTDSQLEEEILGKCCCCNVKWDRYIGKKKCRMCGVPVLLCQDCCTKRVDKSPEFDLKMRCPLCVSENVTVPAADVDFTDNGVHTKQYKGDGGGAAKTVCKWGGGHAQAKKRSRQDDRAKKRLETKPCKFGKECTRTDCWFSHE
jgi:hypothetical protein